MAEIETQRRECPGALNAMLGRRDGGTRCRTYFRATIPYESLDPLAIGATDDESKKHRDTLELEIPTANLVAGDLPGRAARRPATRPRRRAQALESPVDGPTFAELLAGRQASRS